MSIKRILAAAAASVVAAGAMAAVASAATYTETYENTFEAEKININTDGTFWSSIQQGFIEKIDELTITYTTADGDTGFASILTNWGGDEAKDADAVAWAGDGFASWTGAGIALPEGVDYVGTTITVKAVINNIDDYVAKFIETYPENEDGTDMYMYSVGHDDAEVKKIVKATFAEAAAPDESSTPEDSSSEPAPETPNDNNGTSNNVDTGVEGVAAVLGVAAVAAGALIVAKKRK